MLTTDSAKVLAIVTIAGFGVQQFLQLIDPFTMLAIAKFKAKHSLPGGMADSDFKKAVVGWLGTLFGFLVVCVTGVHTLCYVLNPGKCNEFDWADAAVTALVIGAGTEGVNTLLKYFGYVKDARKQNLAASMTVAPASAKLTQGQSLQFIARVDNALSDVEWSVSPGNGGTITPNGLYTAPAAAGTFLVVATNKSDPLLTSFATVVV